MNGFLSLYGDVLFWAILVYLAGISLLSAILTVTDKIRAQRKGARRIPESTLMLLAALGGSVSMLLTMCLIRHKTRHIKFMWGIPIILLFQAVIVLYILRAIL